VTQLWSLLLWSINEQMQGEKGLRIPRPTLEWTSDHLELLRLEAEERKKETD
jgi:hypothetical protein